MSCWKHLLTVFLVGIFVHGSVFAQNAPIQGSGNIYFLSDAPLELISASSNELRGVIDTTTNQFAFSIQIRSFDGFNSPLQREHFNENYLESDEFPKATFTGKIVENMNYTNSDRQAVRAKGNLVIHGVSVHRIIPADIDISNSEMSISAVFFVPLEEHNIRIPKIVHMKIAEEIKVTVNVTFDLE